jgi:hypothetical protein
MSIALRPLSTVPAKTINSPIRPIIWLTALFVVGLLARLAVTVFVADNRTLYFEHMIIARNLLDGKGYSWNEWGRMALQPSSLVLPLYVYWCAFFQWLSPLNFVWMYAAQAVVAASGVFPAYLVGKRLYSHGVGLWFAGLYTFYPEFVFVHSKAVAESILIVVVLWLLERYSVLRDVAPGTRRGVRVAFATGLIAGVGILVKETAAIVAFAMCLAMLMRLRPSRLTLRSHVLPMTAAVLLTLTPWIVRNALVQGEFIPLRTAYGINFWIANVPQSIGNDRTPTGDVVFNALPREYISHMNSILPPDEQDRERAYLRESVQLISADPTGYFSHCMKRLWYWIWFVPAHGLAGNWLYRAGWIGAVLLAVPGVIISRKYQKVDRVFPLIVLGFIVLYIPAIVLPRYRVITALVVLLFAAHSVQYVASAWWTRSRLRHSQNSSGPGSSLV